MCVLCVGLSEAITDSIPLGPNGVGSTGILLYGTIKPFLNLSLVIFDYTYFIILLENCPAPFYDCSHCLCTTLVCTDAVHLKVILND